MKKLFSLAIVAILFSTLVISCSSRSGHKLEEKAAQAVYRDTITAIALTPPPIPIDSFFMPEPNVGEVYIERFMPILDPDWKLVGLISKDGKEDCLWVGSILSGYATGGVDITFEKMDFDMAMNLTGIDDFIKWGDGSITVYVYGNPSEDPFDAHKKIKKFVGEVAVKMNGKMEILDYN